MLGTEWQSLDKGHRCQYRRDTVGLPHYSERGAIVILVCDLIMDLAAPVTQIHRPSVGQTNAR